MAHGSTRALRLVFALAILAAAGGAAAQDAPKWIVDPAHSTLAFDSSAEGAAFEGHFDRWSADIRFDPKALASSHVTVQVETGSAITGDSGRDQTAQSDEWFASPMFPKATFVARTIKDLGGGRYEADGDLTIRDKSQPLALPFTLAIKGDEAVMHSDVDLDRSLWGLGTGEYGGADIVPLKVELKIDLVAHLAK
ncbi:MAG TPA: YceI family protein [Caulobacteraceae bacterium]